jgi:hypothetical protein
MPEFRAARIAAEPIVCNTIVIMPRAISSLGALYRALEKREAVASIGRPGKGRLEISPMERLI